MKRTLIVFLSVIANFLCFSQRFTFNEYELLRNEELKLAPVEFNKQYDGIIGTAYLFDDWMRGRAAIGSKTFSNLKIKFDIFKNKVYLNIQDTVFEIGSGVKRFDLFPNDADTSVFMTFTNEFQLEEESRNTFVQQFTRGKIIFIKYYKKELKEVYESTPYDKQKKFLDDNKYYVIGGDSKLIEVQLNKKNLETILNSKFEDVVKYAKENHISFNKEDGWVELIKYYNKQ